MCVVYKRFEVIDMYFTISVAHARVCDCRNIYMQVTIVLIYDHQHQVSKSS